MGVASIVLGVVSMIFAVAGFILSPIPFVGALLSFGSPLLALIGIVLGGVAMSRAKEDGREAGVPMAGLIVSVVAFFPALLVALTCGVCNSMCSASALRGATQPPTPWYLVDGGNVMVSPGITPVPGAPVPAAPVPGTPVPAPGVPAPGVPIPAPGQAPNTDPNAAPTTVPVAPLAPGVPPPAFPPPPPG